jgi:hypothetical protein
MDSYVLMRNERVKPKKQTASRDSDEQKQATYGRDEQKLDVPSAHFYLPLIIHTSCVCPINHPLRVISI